MRRRKNSRIPVNVEVTGHKSDIKHVDVADFGSVFQGTSKSFQLVLDNRGYGNLNEISYSITDPQFSIVGDQPWQILAREQQVIEVKFSPTAVGNINATLSLTNGDQTYEIALFGVGTETSKISVTPLSQVIDNIVLGDRSSGRNHRRK